jgi:hypothetical protein
MATKRRIPQAFALFNLYIRAFYAWLIAIKSGQTDTNAKRNNITTTEVTTIELILEKWTNDDPLHPGVYELHTKKATKTSVTSARVREVKKEFTSLAKLLLNRIAASPNIEDVDYDLLNIARPTTMHGHHNQNIIANTYLRYKYLGPGMIRIDCYPDKDAKRAKVAREAGANCVQVAICIIAPNNINKENEQSGIVRATKVSSADECPYREIHKKASFVLKFTMEYRKCDLYIFARQYDDGHPELAGPWSEMLLLSIP